MCSGNGSTAHLRVAGPVRTAAGDGRGMIPDPRQIGGGGQWGWTPGPIPGKFIGPPIPGKFGDGDGPGGWGSGVPCPALRYRTAACTIAQDSDSS
jgi:hypothetical protein